MVPGSGIEGGAGLALLRGVSVAAGLAMFGTLLFGAAIAAPVLRAIPQADAQAFARRWRALVWWSWRIAALALLGWLLAETAFIADARGLGATLAIVPKVLTGTSFGHVVAVQLATLALLAIAFAAGGRRPWLAVALAAIGVALQAGHSHALSMYGGPSLLLLSDIVHLLAAGAWLGGLPPLLMLIAACPPGAAALASRRFSPLGMTCVGLLALTAFYQFRVLIGGLPGLFGTGYGRMALLKLGLFAVLFGIAVLNRTRLTPALVGDSPARAKRRLRRSIAVETAIGLIVVLAAGVLSAMPPSMHVQPKWPFAWQLSLVTIREDAGFMREVLLASAALGCGLVLLLAAIALRRLRVAALVLALVIAWFAVPHLDLLVIPADATSFYRSPTGFAATTIAAGAPLFASDCAICHGAQGGGNGPAAASLPVPPANLTAPHLWMHSDGEMFGWVSNGIQAPEGGPAMPGFAGALTDAQRWAVIDYIRANNAGIEMLRAGRWPVPLRAPALQATCHGRTMTLQDLRGRIVRLVIGPASAASDPPGVVTIVAGPHPDAGAACTTADPSVVTAYGVVLGRDAAPGSQFLIDADGWLRAWQGPSTAESWSNPRVLAAAIGDIRSHPVAVPAGGAMPGMKM